MHHFICCLILTNKKSNFVRKGLILRKDAEGKANDAKKHFQNSLSYRAALPVVAIVGNMPEIKWMT